MSDSDSSALSSAPEEEVKKLAPIFARAKKATKLAAPPPKTSPPRPKRAPSPPHEETLADNHNIAFLVMFRSRFASAFPPKMAHLGPQDVERGVSGGVPSKEVEGLLCALLGLVLNRKKPVEHGHYGRALEEAVATQKPQWPYKWAGVNPLHGGRSFDTMSAEDKLYLLRTLAMWSLSSSEAISTTIKDSYKQARHADDENQPLSVQPWGRDGDKRRYFLIEGQDDTNFRVYREAHRYTRNAQWYSMAGSIEEVRVLAQKLEKEDSSQAARTLGQRIVNAVPRFEATEEKRRRREYRQVRRQAFTRPEPGFSLYEGRTRGKRMRYTFDDDEDEQDDGTSDATSNRRSARQSGRNTPAETGPQYTSSGRQVRARQGGEYGASALSGQVRASSPDELAVDDEEDGGRAGRAAARRGEVGSEAREKRKRVVDDDEEDEGSEEDEGVSVDDWDSDANGQDDEEMPDADDEEEGEDEDEDDGEPKSLVVKLRTGTKPQANGHTDPEAAGDVEVKTNGANPDPETETNNQGAQQAESTKAQSFLANGVGHNSSPPQNGYPTPSSLAAMPQPQKSMNGVGLVSQQSSLR